MLSHIDTSPYPLSRELSRQKEILLAVMKFVSSNLLCPLFHLPWNLFCHCISNRKIISSIWKCLLLVTSHTFHEICLVRKSELKGRFPKKIVEFSTKRGGGRIGQFSTKKNIGLKYWKWPKMHFKTNLFFFNFWGGQGSFHHNWSPQASNVSCKAIWQLFADPYHTESVSRHVDHF